MVKSLGMHMYSMGAWAALEINNQDALSDDAENDPFLKPALQRFTCDLYYQFGSFSSSYICWTYYRKALYHGKKYYR